MVSGLDVVEAGQNRGLIAQHAKQIQTVSPDGIVFSHHHHAVVAIEESLESTGCTLEF